MRSIIFSVCVVVAGCLLQGCEGIFGEKTDLGFIDVPDYSTTAVVYVPIQPFFEGFQRPVDACIGFDQLLYVVDSATSQVIQMDESGRELGRINIPGAKKVVQDRRMNLLVLGTYDTTLVGQGGTQLTLKLQAVYRVNLFSGNVLSTQNAVTTNIVRHPFYFKSNLFPSDTAQQLNDIDILDDNTYYVTRTGPNNDPGTATGPDNAVLMFSHTDQFTGFVRISTDQGQISNFFDRPFGITTLAKPGSSLAVSSSRDFIVSVLGLAPAIKVLYIRFGIGPTGDPEYTLNTDLILDDTTRASGFLYTAFRFLQPRGLGYAPDGLNYIYVADSEKDSVYLFTNTGLEGIRPPRGLTATKNISVSFGGRGNGPTQFRHPVEVFSSSRILYVVDRDNGRICRYRLTTDFL